jgi:outer membrane protein OmpA-like peptidoglycan-associated protein
LVKIFRNWKYSLHQLQRKPNALAYRNKILGNKSVKIRLATTIIVAIVISGCQIHQMPHPNYSTSSPLQSSIVTPLNLKELPETISFEHTDRVNRLARLSRQFGAQLPEIQESQVAVSKVPGTNFPVPVIRFHYEERTFFDSGSTIVRPESDKILDVLAEQMKRDLPDTSLVILGHTDSVGADEYNNNLSLNRAAAVMRKLAQRGVNLEQMSTVGIGESQPIATNATDTGKALNRRVEFMLSRFEEANYVAIEQFPRNSAWLNNHQEKSVDTQEQTKSKPVDVGAKELAVLKPTAAMLAKPDPKLSTQANPSESATLLKGSSRVVTIIPAETVHILPSS